MRRRLVRGPPPRSRCCQAGTRGCCRPARPRRPPLRRRLQGPWCACQDVREGPLEHLGVGEGPLSAALRVRCRGALRVCGRRIYPRRPASLGRLAQNRGRTPHVAGKTLPVRAGGRSTQRFSDPASRRRTIGDGRCRRRDHTRVSRFSPRCNNRWMLTDTERGLVAGILLSEGSFGGDGKQPHVILRKHIRDESLVRWLVARFPRSRLYGPYHHGDRSYFQWVARGPALVEDVLPVLDERGVPELDMHPAARAGGRVGARPRRRLEALGERFALPAQAFSALDTLLGLLASGPTAPTTIT